MAGADSDVDMSPPTTPTRISSRKYYESHRNFFDKERLAIAEREQIAEEYARALDEATSCVQQLGLSKATGQLEEALSQVIKRFAHGENLLSNDVGRVGLASSIYARSQGNAGTTKLSYAEVTKTHFPYKLGANLPQKLSNPTPRNSKNARGKVEKAEEWYTCVIDHVPRTLSTLDGESRDVTGEMAREEVQSITGLVPTKLTWSKKTLANPL
ncbi:hypothetical protein EPUL_005640, partial [Erysiphe pulchra]